MVEEKIKMLIEMGLLNLILCKKNHQRTVFHGKAQRILLILVRNVWLGTSGSTRSAVVGMVRRAESWNSWNDQRCLWDKQPELGEICTVLLPYTALSPFRPHFFNIHFKFFLLHEDQSVFNYLSSVIPVSLLTICQIFATISWHLDGT